MSLLQRLGETQRSAADLAVSRRAFEPAGSAVVRTLDRMAPQERDHESALTIFTSINRVFG
jgi:hypothetical protein